MLFYKKAVFWFILFIWLGKLAIASPKSVKKISSLSLRQPIITEMRGIWLSTIYGLDWPNPLTLKASSNFMRIKQQQRLLIIKLDNLVRIGINTIFFQVKPDGSVFYRSNILPWSAVLTGKLGQDPGYDPLLFILTEAHKRHLKVHAWVNPYRVTVNTKPETIEALSIMLRSSKNKGYNLRREWIRTASGCYVLDPGLPNVRHWIVTVITELIKNYSVDGIQFDDYFYHETSNSQLDDDITYQVYGKKFTTKAEWRRNNTLLMIQQVSSLIKSFNAKIDFAISPSGVWRNKTDDPRGSATHGGDPAYDIAYADIRLWVKKGLLDYIAPQLYWPVGSQCVRYDVLAKWWADLVYHTHTRLYIGIALYKINKPTRIEPDWGVGGGVTELKKQLDINKQFSEIHGIILFSESYLNQPQTNAAVNYLKHRWNLLTSARIAK